MMSWTPEEPFIWNHRKCKCCVARYSITRPRHISEARDACVPASPTTSASFLIKGTHRSAECLPERDTLLPTGDGRLLPLCRSSMDLLQGFDLSTELSTVFSTLSKSKLKQKKNATEGLKIHIHTNTWTCVTCSFLLQTCTLTWVVFANKEDYKGNTEEFPRLSVSCKNTEWHIPDQAKEYLNNSKTHCIICILL